MPLGRGHPLWECLLSSATHDTNEVPALSWTKHSSYLIIRIWTTIFSKQPSFKTNSSWVKWVGIIECYRQLCWSWVSVDNASCSPILVHHRSSDIILENLLSEDFRLWWAQGVCKINYLSHNLSFCLNVYLRLLLLLLSLLLLLLLLL